MHLHSMIRTAVLVVFWACPSLFLDCTAEYLHTGPAVALAAPLPFHEQRSGLPGQPPRATAPDMSPAVRIREALLP